MITLRPVRCDQCGEICNHADEMGPAYSERQCGCYRELDPIPKCCGTCDHMTMTMDTEEPVCTESMSRREVIERHGVCGFWEKAND